MRKPFFFQVQSIRRPAIPGYVFYKDHSRVETAMKATMRHELDAFGANLQCCLSLLLPLGSCEFFFESHVDQTV